jgi:hypothetical protein
MAFDYRIELENQLVVIPQLAECRTLSARIRSVTFSFAMRPKSRAGCTC